MHITDYSYVTYQSNYRLVTAMKAENSLDFSFFREIVDSNWVAITFADMNGVVQYANATAYKLYGYNAPELEGKTVDIFNGDDSLQTESIVNEIIGKGAWSGYLTQKKKDGTRFPAQLTVWLIKNSEGEPIGLGSNSRDVSEDRNAEAQLKKTIEEKEILLNEIHHRVKNNLAIVSSLLQLEEIKTDNREVAEILVSSQNRIKSTALVHEFLYQNDSIGKIKFREYTRQFLGHISTSMTPDIATSVSGNDFQLNIEEAIPCGLILNELFTNSVKHAFEGIDSPKVDVELFKNGDEIRILFSDNGTGFKPDDSEDKVGMKVINTLIKQINGSITRTDLRQGTSFHIKFDRSHGEQ